MMSTGEYGDRLGENHSDQERRTSNKHRRLLNEGDAQHTALVEKARGHDFDVAGREPASFIIVAIICSLNSKW